MEHKTPPWCFSLYGLLSFLSIPLTVWVLCLLPMLVPLPREVPSCAADQLLLLQWCIFDFPLNKHICSFLFALSRPLRACLHCSTYTAFFVIVCVCVSFPASPTDLRTPAWWQLVSFSSAPNHAWPWQALNKCLLIEQTPIFTELLLCIISVFQNPYRALWQGSCYIPTSQMWQPRVTELARMWTWPLGSRAQALTPVLTVSKWMNEWIKSVRFYEWKTGQVNAKWPYETH